jgi:hypothetical protein
MSLKDFETIMSLINFVENGTWSSIFGFKYISSDLPKTGA